MQNIDEGLLIIQLKAGYERAVRDWFVWYSPRIKAAVAQKVSVNEDVDEIVQEVFLACLRELIHFKNQSSLSTWMLSVTRHKIADYYRAKYAKRVIHLVALLDGLPTALTSVGDDISENVAQTLAKINDFEREILLAKYVDGKSVAQIAQQLSKSVKSIESSLFRARLSFKKEYALIADYS